MVILLLFSLYHLCVFFNTWIHRWSTFNLHYTSKSSSLKRVAKKRSLVCYFIPFLPLIELFMLSIVLFYLEKFLSCSFSLNFSKRELGNSMCMQFYFSSTLPSTNPIQPNILVIVGFWLTISHVDPREFCSFIGASWERRVSTIEIFSSNFQCQIALYSKSIQLRIKYNR